MTAADPLFDPARHEPLGVAAWDADVARAAIQRIAAAAEAEFEPHGPHAGSWRIHPGDDADDPDRRSFEIYFGAGGVIWALQHLASLGAIELHTDIRPWIDGLVERNRPALASSPHGVASYLCGDAGLLLLQWKQTRDTATADVLFATVEGNLHNPVNEALWGNAGTLLAAIHLAEASGEPRWKPMVQRGVQAILDDMRLMPDTGTWASRQDMYGRVCWYLGAGHGLVGNVYPALRAAGMLDASIVETLLQRAFDTLEATALRDGACINWHALMDADALERARLKGYLPLVQDCHGAPGVVCRLATAPRSDEWDALLHGAGELTWQAGPLVKGPGLCHGTAGSVMACLKLWRRFGDELWLHRARLLAMHAIGQCERQRREHGVGRHSLWTGDLGLACALWNCLAPDDRLPTLDHF